MTTPPQTDDPLADQTVGATVHRLSEQLPELVRSEVRLAQAELAEKGKRAGLGIGLFGAAGVFGLYALAGVFLSVAILLDLVLPLWGAALIVTGVLLVLTLGLALNGRAQVSQATPAAPERAIAGVKEDVEAVKGHTS
jgi:uncharacterized membrane protein YqjE